MTVPFEITVFLFVLVLVRVSMFVMTLPQFGSAVVPTFIKAGLALSLSVFWFSEAAQPSADIYRAAFNQNWFGWVWLAGREALTGAMLGMTFSLFLIPFRIAGEFIGQEMGLTLASITDPSRVQFGTVVGQIFEIIGVLFLFSLNVHHVFLTALHASWARRPLGSVAAVERVDVYVEASAHAQEWGMLLAAPIICCLFATSIVLALMTRAAPQMNIMTVGFAMRLAVGLVASVVFLPELSPAMQSVFQKFGEYVYLIM